MLLMWFTKKKKKLLSSAKCVKKGLCWLNQTPITCQLPITIMTCKSHGLHQTVKMTQKWVIFPPKRHIVAFMCYIVHFKGIVHPKMKISQRFTHPQGILCVSDIPLSDEHIQLYSTLSCLFQSVAVWSSFVMDRYFFGFRNRGRIHCNYTDWNRQDNVEYNSECVHLKEEYQTHIGCLEGEVNLG